MTATQPSNRLLSLDVFRGLVIAAMILVENPGSRHYSYRQLDHAPWFGATATDMIFPAFLFMAGIAIPFAFSSRLQRGESRAKLALHILRRSVELFVLGLAINGFPVYHLHTLRIPGVLQRAAICYLCGGVLYLLATNSGAKISRRVALLAAIGFAALAIYWALLKLVPVPGIGAGHLDSYGNLPAYIDRSVFGLRHMWAYGTTPGMGVTYDPEGILSTLPSLFNTIAGILTGEWLRSTRSDKSKALGLALAGVGFIVVGWALSPLMPFNKRIWTSTFSLFSAGVSLAVFAAVYAIVDLYRLRRGTTPLLILGTNAILAYMVSNVLEILMGRHFLQHGATQTVHNWLYDHLFTWTPLYVSSLAYAIVLVAFNMLLIYPLYRKRLFVKL